MRINGIALYIYIKVSKKNYPFEPFLEIIWFLYMNISCITPIRCRRCYRLAWLSVKEEGLYRVLRLPRTRKLVLNNGRITGASAGGASFLLLLLLAGVCAYRQKKRRERASEQKNHFGILRFQFLDLIFSHSSLKFVFISFSSFCQIAAYLDLKNSDRVPQLKGAKCFSLDEITKCTNNFSEANHIGSGGYGMASLSLFSYPSMVVSFAYTMIVGVAGCNFPSNYLTSELAWITKP